jgi:hypothetical protein
MITHTPGPWEYVSGMVVKGEIPIARMDRETPLTAPWERDRNARLCAAAPSMLSALESARELITHYLGTDVADVAETLGEIDRAIEGAKGTP